MSFFHRLHRVQEVRTSSPLFRRLMNRTGSIGPRWGEYVGAVKKYLSSQRKRRRLYFSVIIGILALSATLSIKDQPIVTDILSSIAQFFGR